MTEPLDIRVIIGGSEAPASRGAFKRDADELRRLIRLIERYRAELVMTGRPVAELDLALLKLRQGLPRRGRDAGEGAPAGT